MLDVGECTDDEYDEVVWLATVSGTASLSYIFNPGAQEEDAISQKSILGGEVKSMQN